MKTLPKAMMVFPSTTKAKLVLTRQRQATPIMTSTELMLHLIKKYYYP